MLLCFLLQSTLFTGIDFAGIVPDLIIILVVTVGYQYGKLPGMFTGMAGGLLLDFQFGQVLGVCALCYLFVGYACGFLNTYYVKYDVMLPLCLVAVAEFVFSFYGYVVKILINGDLNIGFYFKRVMLPKVAYTVIAAIILYRLFDLLYVNTVLAGEEEV